MGPRPWRLASAVVCLMLGLPAGTAAAGPAVVMDFQGEVVQEPGGVPVGLLDTLAEGARVRLGPGGVLMLNYVASGLREEITGRVWRSLAGKAVRFRTGPDAVRTVPVRFAAGFAGTHAG